MEDFLTESAIMLEFRHPNVLNLIGVCFDSEDQVPVIVLPLMTNGDLRMFLLEKRKQLKPKKAYPEVISYFISLDSKEYLESSDGHYIL